MSVETEIVDLSPNDQKIQVPSKMCVIGQSMSG